MPRTINFRLFAWPPYTSYGTRSGRRKANGGLKDVVATFAAPKVPYVVGIYMFRPFRHKKRIAASGTFDRRAWSIAGAIAHGGAPRLRIYVRNISPNVPN